MNSSNIPSAESVPEDKIASPHHRKMLEQIIDAVYGNGDKLVFIDLFCGAGGMSEGLAQSLEEIADVLGCRVDEFATLHAVNHDSAAIKAHSSNHAWATHYEVPIQQIEPEDVVGRDTTVSLMLAAPDCTHHSNARGGGPKDPDARMQPREVLTWAERIDVRNLLIENVPALRGWGPLNSNNRIIPDKKGEFFDHWLKGLSIEGFNVEHRVLCCADYGDATTRKRLFIACRKDDGVSWPEKSHSEDGSGDTEEWQPAANIIDWDDPGESLWVRDLHDGRRNPLAHSTMQRIAAGMRRHAGDA
jgi:DNA (cytosine-5)-methyltransferase 1